MPSTIIRRRTRVPFEHNVRLMIILSESTLSDTRACCANRSSHGPWVTEHYDYPDYVAFLVNTYAFIRIKLLTLSSYGIHSVVSTLYIRRKYTVQKSQPNDRCNSVWFDILFWPLDVCETVDKSLTKTHLTNTEHTSLLTRSSLA